MSKANTDVMALFDVPVYKVINALCSHLPRQKNPNTTFRTNGFPIKGYLFRFRLHKEIHSINFLSKTGFLAFT